MIGIGTIFRRRAGSGGPLKLNNFLFAAMSGVGGYDIASTNILPDRANVTVTDNRIIHRMNLQ